MKKQLIIFAVCCIASSACVREVDIFLPDNPVVTNAEFNDLFQTLKPATETFQVATDQDTTLLSLQNIQLFVPQHAFSTLSGTPVSGMVEVHLSNAFRKGALVANRMSTSTQVAVFEHIGAIYIEATQNNQPLKMAPSAKLRFDIPRAPSDTDIRLFKGVNDQEGKTLWLDTNEQNLIAASEMFNTQTQLWETSWQWESASMGWVACGQYLEAEYPHEFCVTLPDDFDGSNTAVFAVFEDVNSVVELEWKASSGGFCSNLIPEGRVVTLLSISAKEQNHYLGYAEAVLEGSSLTIPIQPIGTDPAVLAQLLDEL